MTGELTFLFTDIEGSTKLWEAQPEAMRVVLARHDALLRQCIEANGGHIFKTVGDAFCAAFASAADGVSAALAVQRALRAEGWLQIGHSILVRMALHTGAAEQRDGDYFGLHLNHVSRLLALAHGGQTLLSEITQTLCLDRLPSGATLKSLGEYRLKGLIHPETVFQLCHPDLPQSFPQLRHLATIGVLQIGLGDPSTPDFLPWSPKPLSDLGWVEGQNLVVERRYAGGRAELLKPFAEDLVRLQVEIIVTNGTDAAIAAKQATSHIPIVMYGAGDPVATGLVASLSHPGGNITGFSLGQISLRVKRLRVLQQMLPSARRIGELVNPTNPFSNIARKEYEDAYRSLGLNALFVDVSSASELGDAFARLRRMEVQALVVPSDGLFISNAVWIMRTAAAQAMPTMVDNRAMLECGGLFSYAYSAAEEDQRFALFVDKILRGAKPADLPIEEPTKFELLLNLRTAKMIGLTVPESMLLRADEVIQ